MHNNLIKYITDLIDIDRFLMYADISFHNLPGRGTVTPCDRTETRFSNYR